MIMDHSLSDRFRPLVFILCCTGYLFPAAGQSQYRAQLRALSYEASEASVRTTEASVASPAPGPNVADGVSAAFRVTNTNDSGPGSLRQAILDANATAARDSITFGIGTGPVVINLTSAGLPVINYPVVIDGTTQGGYTGEPLIMINGGSLPLSVDGLTLLAGAAGSTIRGLVIGYFSGNGISLAASSCVIEGCYIGVTDDGTHYFNNLGSGLFVQDASNCRIGGNSFAKGNVISGNAQFGIIIRGNCAFDTVTGNRIGTDYSATSILRNAWDGVRLNIYGGTGAHNCVIGGSEPGSANIIAGNDSSGVSLYGSAVINNRIIGNYIGTNPPGSTTIGNGGDGIRFYSSSTSTGGTAGSNFIGGTLSAEANIIAANHGNGIRITGAAAGGGGGNNRIVGNFIGVFPSNSGAFGNTGHGISIATPFGGAITGTMVGGKTADSANTISGNHRAGVSLTGSGVSRTRIVGNSIYGNDSLGIDLGPAGISPNDTLDADAGPNGMQNFPVIDSIRVVSGDPHIHYSFMSAPSATFDVALYSSPDPGSLHFGEAKTYLGSVTATTDAAGRANLDYVYPGVIPSTDFLTMIATDTQGNSSELSQAFSRKDTDGDGILDMWETPGWGIDVNSDGIVDIDLNARGAWPDHKEIFVEVDAMVGFQPKSEVLSRVKSAFGSVANKYVNNPDGLDGIDLIIDPLDADSAITAADFPNVWADFNSVKQTRFGTKKERDSSGTNARYVLQAKRLVYRYCIFAKTFGNGAERKNAGIAEIGGNDFMVTFGAWASFTADDQAGTFMHELGHTLGLRHGGGDSVNYKPNYYSVMNYTWQQPYTQWQSPGTWKLVYSPAELPSLDENQLNEKVGLNPPPADYPDVIKIPYQNGRGELKYAALLEANTDWNGNISIEDGPVAVDLNSFPQLFGIYDGPPPGKTVLTGHADWPNLVYNFRNSADFADGSHGPADTVANELTFDTYLALQNMPPPKPEGIFVMDGVLDGIAVPVGSNGGVSLYAALRQGQLYVAATAAPSLGRDVIIYVATAQRPMQAAALGKGGQAGRWAAALSNTNADNASAWYDVNSSLNPIGTVDTAGVVVEGVVDLWNLLHSAASPIYLAAGTYQPTAGGTLVSQVPAGDGNGDIDSTEFLLLPDGALPIQLAGFSAVQLTSHTVQLTWKTVSETDNYGFEVQRRTPAELDFRTLPGSFIAGHGTTNAPQTYTFVDSAAATGRQWYRLRQIDLDGSEHFSDPVAVDVALASLPTDAPREFALFQNTPNPFNPSTSICYTLPTGSFISLKVYDIVGREVATVTSGFQQAGTYRVQFDATALAGGVYVYRLEAGKFIASNKMLLLK